MRWLKYIRLNRKDLLKNMRVMTLVVAMLTDCHRVPQCNFKCLPMCDWAPMTLVIPFGCTLVPHRSAPLCLAHTAYRHIFTKDGFLYYHFTSLIRQLWCPQSAKGNTI